MSTISNYFNLIIVQVALTPFTVALVSCLILRRWMPAFITLAVPLGWLAAVLSITGVYFFPVSATQKITLLCLLATPIGLCLNSDSMDGSIRRVTFGLLIAGALLWSFSGFYSHISGLDLLIKGIGGWVFIHWTLRSLDSQRKHAIPSCVVILSLALGIAAAAAASSTLIAQLSLAMAFSALAFLLCACFLTDIRTTAVLTFAAGLGLTLLAYAAVLLDNLPWYALIPFVFVPLVARIPLNKNLSAWSQAGILLLCCSAVSSCGYLLARFV